MDPVQQTHAFDQLANKAKRAGLLRYHKHGLIVITLPDPSPTLAKRVAPPASEPPATTPPPAGS